MGNGEKFILSGTVYPNMAWSRRQWLKLSATGAAVGLSGCLGTMTGGEYPNESINIVVGFPEGGGADTHTRKYRPHISDELGVSLEIENNPGSGGLVGTTQVYNAEPDGYTIGAVTPPTEMTAQTQNPQDYDLTDFEAIATMGIIGMSVVTHEDHNIQDFEELASKFQDGEFTHIGASEGSALEVVLAPMLSEEQYGLEYQNLVGYGGTGETLQAVLNKEIDAGLTSIPATSAAVGDGINPVVVLGDSRDPALPDVPSISDDLGYPEIGAASAAYVGFLAPPETSQDRVEKLANSVEEASQSDEIQSWHEDDGMDITVMKTTEFQNTLEELSDLVDQFTS